MDLNTIRKNLKELRPEISEVLTDYGIDKFRVFVDGKVFVNNFDFDDEYIPVYVTIEEDISLDLIEDISDDLNDLTEDFYLIIMDYSKFSECCYIRGLEF